MKKLLILAIPVVFFIGSCKNSNQESLNKLANEMCAVMVLYDETDPLSIMDVQTALNEIAKNTNDYKNITQVQLEDAMKTICPEGFQKLKYIMSSGK